MNKEQINGELSFDGIETLYNNLILSTINKQTKFLDVGCGYGKILSYIREKNSSINLTGIEIVEDRIEIAKKIYLNSHCRKINFISGDILNHLHLIKNNHIIYMNNVLFTEYLNEKIWSNMIESQLLFCTNIKYFDNYKIISVLNVGVSWSRSQNKII